MADLIEDILADFSDGVNSDPPPLKLARTQLSFATNTTVRGQYARPRPPYNQIQLDAAWEVISTGLFQAALYYKPDAGTEFLLIAVSGNLYKVELNGTTTQVNDVGTMQSPVVPQHWMWQAEKWVIWNDGISLPVFFDGDSCRRSNGSGDTPNFVGYTGSITGVVSGLAYPSDYTNPALQDWHTAYENPGPDIVLSLSSPYTGAIGSFVQFTVNQVEAPNSSNAALKANYAQNGPYTNMPPSQHSFSVVGISGNNITVRPRPGTILAYAWPPWQGTQFDYQWKVTIPNGTIREFIPPYAGALSADLVLPNPTDVGDSFTIPLTVPFTGQVGNYIQVGGPSLNFIFKVTAIGASDVTATSYNVVIPGGTAVTGAGSFIVVSGAAVVSTTVDTTPELPAGKMGAYGMGRIVMALADGKRFIISDIVGGSSGTLAYNFRDSVLHITENAYLAGGGYFTIPGGVGDIRAIKFTATLDVSLGQGPCQIFTPTHVFSVNVPVDRTIWAELTNPILTQTLITNGGLSQNGTINANGDLIFRSVDGIRSLILARRDFATWGNVPMSTEMDRVLAEDQAILLAFSSAIVFDNRLLMTAGPHASDQGVYHDKLIALNFDPVSSLRGKAPSVYDGVWDGIDVLQLVEGMFTGEQRAFAFTRNTETEAIELYELMPSNTAMIYDNGTDRIQWSFETAAIFKEGYYSRHDLLRLIDGEINVDQLEGRVNFSAYYRPDGYPCWVLWHEWDQCAQTGKAPLPIPANADTLQVQFRPRMGLGEPRPSDCDPSTNRPTREGYYFQLKYIITGQVRFLGSRYRAARIPQPKFAPPICCT